MNYSDFKCKACGGNRIIYRQDTDNPYDHYACPCKRTATETIPLEVPDGYELTVWHDFYMIANGDEPDWIKKGLKHKIGDTQTFVCEVCGGGGAFEVCFSRNQGACGLGFSSNACTLGCGNCKGSPEIHATVAAIRVEIITNNHNNDKKTNLLIDWSE